MQAALAGTGSVSRRAALGLSYVSCVPSTSSDFSSFPPFALLPAPRVTRLPGLCSATGSQDGKAGPGEGKPDSSFSQAIRRRACRIRGLWEKMQFSNLPDDENHLVINVVLQAPSPRSPIQGSWGREGLRLSQTPAVCVFRQVWQPLRAVQRARPLLEPSGFPPRIPQATLPEWH